MSSRNNSKKPQSFGGQRYYQDEDGDNSDY
jgi:hypothetical protein